MYLKTSLGGVVLFLALLVPAVASAQTSNTSSASTTPSCKLTPKDQNLIKGETYTLTWHSTSTTQGEITGIGPVSPNGSLALAPVQSFHFVGTFFGPHGTTTCTANVVIITDTSGSPLTGGAGSTGSVGTTSLPGREALPPTEQSSTQTQPEGISPTRTQTQSSSGSNGGAGLVPCGVTGDPTACQACDVISLANRVISFLIGLSIPIAIILFAYAGVLYFTSGATSAENIGRAKNMFRTAIVGMVIALSAYLVVETLLHTLLSQKYWSSWNHIDCVSDPSLRPRDKTIGDLFSEAITSYTQGPGAAGGTGNTTTGAIGTVTTIGADGKPITVSFTRTGNLADQQQTYLKVLSTYGTQITSACANSSIPNCQSVVAADIVAESGGNPNLTPNSFGAVGLMQITSGPGAQCGSNTQCQINYGVQELTADYNKFQNVPNALAAFNSGASTVPGQASNGLNSAMVSSVNCPGEFAWQCGVNPGGLEETQHYVVTICSLLSNNQISC